MCYAYTNTPFEDVRIQRSEWRQRKKEFPFGQLPVLELEDGVQIPQSYAIARYVGRKVGLAGANEVEAALVDAVADLYKDLIVEIAPYLHRRNDEQKDALFANQFEPAIKKFFPLFEKQLKASGSGFFVKSGSSWADFFVAEGFQSLKNVEPGVIAKWPFALEFLERVHSLPALKEYVAGRPHSDF
ncbi:hypothetical protein M3Y99_00889200 [Aphelenchoides fujianensis]|nr:hypothetical protein M3Y99_00889200 [Aphelenchoides fujianensis]